MSQVFHVKKGDQEFFDLINNMFYLLCHYTITLSINDVCSILITKICRIC